MLADPGPGGVAYLPSNPKHQAVIGEAHLRSRGFGLDTTDRPDFSGLPKTAFHEALEANRFLYQHAAPVMETLYEQIANTHSMVALTDSSGLILHSLGDSDFLEKAAQVALMPGVDWSEKSKGTNAVGTALAEEQPIVVHGRDHYLFANQFLACSCTPIFDPHGKVVGALDVTGDERSYHHHTMALVRMSAQMIENQMFGNVFPDAVRIHFHSRPEFLGTLVEGIVVFSQDGRFLSANRSAQFQLGHSVNSLRAHTFSSLFGQAISQFFDRLRGSAGKPVLLCLHNGVSVWCQARLRQVNQWLMPAMPAVAAPPVSEVEEVRGTPRRWEKPGVVGAATSVPSTPVGRLAARAGLSGLHYLDTGDPQVSAVLRKLQLVQGRDIPIMILGETGTGKDILAQAIHNDSERAERPFVSVNCASIPETLIESELFGYEEGAFTGARRKGSLGKIQQANGGTLFLDEIGDMPTQLQARLLRVLQERRVNPLGSNKEYEVDLTIICATNRNLKELIARGQFREDLYYRLNGLVVRLPALRNRTDFEVVARKILASLCERGNQIDIAPEVMALFKRYPWPGNFRQLHNLMRTAVAMVGCEGRIEVSHLPDDFLDEVMDEALAPAAAGVAVAEVPSLVAQAMPPTMATGLPPFPSVPMVGQPAPPLAAAPARPDAHKLEDMTLQAMADALRRCRGNVSAAAKALGVSRNTIYRKKDLLPPDVWA
ncbi:sigma-54-dependent Fis family transcriptional regulator [Aquabacterium sp. A08]|uniref:sigma-54-dependent Fis family transcriptional regulator n=1 Tax=Aquabacterium sp. A08 TaxID=2718532 RepID=UPI0014219A18|nr:sigma-54-dependent Fis family transcriptional regulator [Aquabacterium sp. A08]NIC43650.1 sigma-54-dependent Fis family transcriptional regulator [Aquabacterium sp. A08]